MKRPEIKPVLVEEEEANGAKQNAACTHSLVSSHAVPGQRLICVTFSLIREWARIEGSKQESICRNYFKSSCRTVVNRARPLAFSKDWISWGRVGHRPP